MTLYERKEFKSTDGNTLPYRILFPESYDSTKKYPLILFLHGAGERGDDNETQLMHGAKLFLKEENRKQHPAIVVFPQCPKEGYWSAVKVDRSKMPLGLDFNYDKGATPQLVAAIELTKKIIAEEQVDTTQLYMIGLSMGGMGTFESVYRHPEMFAAVMPICGGGDTTRYDSRVLKTSFWAFHGEKDDVVRVENSRVMVDKLQSLNADIKYTEYPGVKHNSWTNAFAEPDFLNWLFSNKKKP
jgi:predicted peptidase